MMLCLGWKCLKKFCSISSSFLQKITFQNFNYDLMIKAGFNRMYKLRHESVLETIDFFVFLAKRQPKVLLQKMVLTENVQLKEFWPPGCGSVPANFWVFSLVKSWST